MPPIPKRSTERRRRNADSRPEKVEVQEPVVVPELPERTHVIARQWYESLQKSGQSRYFEPSDWAAAVLVAAALTRLLNTRTRFNSMAFTACWNAMNDLLTTEAARRKARIEVERAVAPPDTPGVSAMDEYRKRLAK